MSEDLSLDINESWSGNAHRSWWSLLTKRATRHAADHSPYRRLALQLHYELECPEFRRSALLVTAVASPLCANGSLVLAGCLGEELRRPVLLIDTCIDNPFCTRILHCEKERGFADVLSDPDLLDELVLPTSQNNVFFLPAGVPGSASGEKPWDVDTILKAAEEKYDFVLLAGGGVLSDSIALAAGPSVGRVLLLVFENVTMLEDLGAAQEALYRCKVKNLGIVLTTPVRGWRLRADQ